MAQTNIAPTPWNLETSQLSEYWLKGLRSALAFARWNESLAFALLPFHPMNHHLNGILSQDAQENDALNLPTEVEVLERWRTALSLSLSLAQQLIEEDNSMAYTVLPCIEPLAVFTGAEAETTERLITIGDKLRASQAPSWNETPSWRKRAREEMAGHCQRIVEALEEPAKQEDAADFPNLLLKAFYGASDHCPWGCAQI